MVRFAFDGPHTYGRAGARWYMSHHAFPRRLSQHLAGAVHTYVFDPDDLELVVSYGTAATSVARRCGTKTPTSTVTKG